MSNINDLLSDLCPEGVIYKRVEEFATCVAGATPSKNDKSYWLDGTIPWMSSGEVNKKEIYDTDSKITQKGYDSASTKMIPPNTVVMALAGQGKTRGMVAITRIELCTNQSLCAFVTDKSIIPEFLFYFFESKYKELRSLSNGDKDGARGGLNLKILRKIVIPVPPLEVQLEIVRVLDSFTAHTKKLIEELTEELIARKKQYKYYIMHILNSENSTSERMTLGDIYDFKYGTGNTIPTGGGEYPVYGSNGIVGWHSVYNSDDAPVIGHIGAYAGIVNWAKGKHFVTYNGVICKHVNMKVDKRYAYYLLLIQDFLSEQKGAQPFVSYDVLKRPEVIIPNMSDQKRIVGILDEFEVTCNELNNLLRLELETCQKQYDYYRDKLLSFKELTA